MKFKYEEVFDEMLGLRGDIDTEVDDSITQGE